MSTYICKSLQTVKSSVPPTAFRFLRSKSTRGVGGGGGVVREFCGAEYRVGV